MSAIKELYAERVLELADELHLEESQVYDLLDILGDAGFNDPLQIAFELSVRLYDETNEHCANCQEFVCDGCVYRERRNLR